MGRGRKPAPTALKLLSGVRPGRINQNEPPRLAELPLPPELVTGNADALAEWNRLVPLLDQMGILSTVDGSALVAYCVAYGQFAEATKALRKFGMVVKGGTGSLKTSPFVAIQREALATMTRLITEFGATPASRSKLDVKGNQPVDKLDAFLSKRG